MAVKLLLGTEMYLINKMLAEKIAELLYPQFNLLISEGFGKEELLFCQTAPFMDTQKILIIKPEKSFDDKLFIEQLGNFDNIEIYLSYPNIDKRKTLYKKLQKNASTFNKLSLVELRAFISLELPLSDELMDFFIDYIGYLKTDDVSLYSVENAIRRLKNLSVVNKKAIENLVDRCLEDNIFKVVDSILLLKDNAIDLLEDVLQKVDKIALLSLLGSDFLALYKIKLDSTKTAADMGMKEFRFQSLKKFTNISAKTAFKAMEICFDCVEQIKKGYDYDCIAVVVEIMGLIREGQ